jgi:hypothetical protein
MTEGTAQSSGSGWQMGGDVFPLHYFAHCHLYLQIMSLMGPVGVSGPGMSWLQPPAASLPWVVRLVLCTSVSTPSVGVGVSYLPCSEKM